MTGNGWPPRAGRTPSSFGALAPVRSAGPGVPGAQQTPRWYDQPGQRPAGSGPGAVPPPGDAVSPSELPADEAFRAAVREVLQGLVDQIDPDADRDRARQQIADEVRQRIEDGGIRGPLLAVAMQQRLVAAVYDELFGLGPLQPLLEDPQVENIDINGCDRVFVSYSDGTRKRGPAVAASDEELVEKIRWWARQGNTTRAFSEAEPLLNVALEELGGARLSAVMSVTPRPHVSIRRHRLVDVTLEDLARLGTIDQVLVEFLRAAVRARLNIVITGGTNVGKTTLLRALTSCIDPDERIATLETDFELHLHRLEQRHQDVLPFEARASNSEGVGAITLHDLIPQALRHNPRRIIVGECRSTEIVPMLEAMQSGHEGSMCTVHADRAEDLFNRALILALRGDLTLPPQAIHLMVGMSVDLVVHLRRDTATHTRYVNEVLEVLEPADTDRPSTNRVFAPGAAGRAVPAITPHCMSRLEQAGLDPRVLQHRGGLWNQRQDQGESS